MYIKNNLVDPINCTTEYDLISITYEKTIADHGLKIYI